MNGEHRQQPLLLGGFEIYQNWLNVDMQAGLIEAARNVAAAAPLFRPETRFGKQMSVRMTSAGHWGWIADAGQSEDYCPGIRTGFGIVYVADAKNYYGSNAAHY